MDVKKTRNLAINHAALQIEVDSPTKAQSEVKHTTYQHNRRQTFSSILVQAVTSLALPSKGSRKKREGDFSAAPFTYCLHADTELHYHRERESYVRSGNQSKYSRNDQDNGMKTPVRIFPSVFPLNIWDYPEITTKANVSTRFVKEICRSRSLQNGRDSPEHTTNVKDSMKVRKEIYPAENYKSGKRFQRSKPFSLERQFLA